MPSGTSLCLAAAVALSFVSLSSTERPGGQDIESGLLDESVLDFDRFVTVESASRQQETSMAIGDYVQISWRGKPAYGALMRMGIDTVDVHFLGDNGPQTGIPRSWLTVLSRPPDVPVGSSVTSYYKTKDGDPGTDKGAVVGIVPASDTAAATLTVHFADGIIQSGIPLAWVTHLDSPPKAWLVGDLVASYYKQKDDAKSRETDPGAVIRADDAYVDIRFDDGILQKQVPRAWITRLYSRPEAVMVGDSVASYYKSGKNDARSKRTDLGAVVRADDAYVDIRFDDGILQEQVPRAWITHLYSRPEAVMVGDSVASYYKIKDDAKSKETDPGAVIRADDAYVDIRFDDGTFQRELPHAWVVRRIRSAQVGLQVGDRITSYYSDPRSAISKRTDLGTILALDRGSMDVDFDNGVVQRDIPIAWVTKIDHPEIVPVKISATASLPTETPRLVRSTMESLGPSQEES